MTLWWDRRRREWICRYYAEGAKKRPDGTPAPRVQEVLGGSRMSRAEAEAEYLARRRAAKTRAAASGRRYPISTRSTVAELGRWHLEAHGPGLSPGYRRFTAAAFQRLGEWFSARAIGELRGPDVTEYQRARLAAPRKAGRKGREVGRGLKAASVNHDVAVLSTALSRAVARGFLPTHPLARGSYHALPEPRKTDFLSPEEWRLLRAAFDDEDRWKADIASTYRRGVVAVDFQSGEKRADGARRPGPGFYSRADFARAMDACEAILLSGSRPSEVCHLTWSAVDRGAGHLVIEQQKLRSSSTRRWKRVPLVDENGRPLPLLSLLERQPAGVGEAPIFRLSSGAPVTWALMYRALRRARRIIGLTRPVTPHLLRHTAASWAVKAGVGIYDVSNLLGHASVAMTSRYAHLRPESLVRACTAIAAQVPEIAAPRRRHEETEPTNAVSEKRSGQNDIERHTRRSRTPR